jgi:hypothetical protein
MENITGKDVIICDLYKCFNPRTPRILIMIPAGITKYKFNGYTWYPNIKIYNANTVFAKLITDKDVIIALGVLETSTIFW